MAKEIEMADAELDRVVKETKAAQAGVEEAQAREELAPPELTTVERSALSAVGLSMSVHV